MRDRELVARRLPAGVTDRERLADHKPVAGFVSDGLVIGRPLAIRPRAQRGATSAHRE